MVAKIFVDLGRSGYLYPHQTHQWNQIEDTDSNPYIYECLIFDKEVEIIQ